MFPAAIMQLLQQYGASVVPPSRWDLHGVRVGVPVMMANLHRRQWWMWMVAGCGTVADDEQITTRNATAPAPLPPIRSPAVVIAPHNAQHPNATAPGRRLAGRARPTARLGGTRGCCGCGCAGCWLLRARRIVPSPCGANANEPSAKRSRREMKPAKINQIETKTGLRS